MNIPALKKAVALCAMLCMLATFVLGQTNSNTGWYWVADAHERSQGLPPGLRRTVETNGDVDHIDFHYTTHAYQKEAARLMLAEASHAAQVLHLENDQPMTPANTRAYPAAFELFYQEGHMGNVETTNYAYRFLDAGRLSRIEIADSYEVWRELQNELLPENQVDNRAACQLATQWLSSLSVDVPALNRDCQLSVASSPVFNYVGSGKEPIRRMFAPIYDIEWKSSNGPAAYVQLYLPDKLLIQLSLDDLKYDLRPPLVFTNLTALFPGSNAVTTNYPITPVVVMPLWDRPNVEVTFVTDSNQPEPAFHDVPLTRWIKTQTHLNTNNLSLSRLMTLKPVSGPDEWGVVAMELPIPYDALNHDHPLPGGQIDLGRFDTDGNFIQVTLEDCARAPNGNTLISWNINWETPGIHQLRARMMYFHGMDGDQFNLIGPPLPYYSSNTCRFYEDSTLFTSDGADLYAKLREPAAKFRIEIRSSTGRLINDISSSTTNGEINLAWDLTGLDGQKYTSNSFIGSFYVTYPDDTGSNAPVKAHFAKIGTSGD